MLAMTKARKTVVIVIATLALALVMFVTALFRGYFDHGLFEVKDVQWSPAKEIAVVAKRSDHDAMNSDAYFVLIGDHFFSEPELRHAYHSAAVIFATDSDCLTLRWVDPHNLTVGCTDRSIDPGHIEVQQRRHGEVAISYVNIPDMNARNSGLSK
jgi:hypothetical protein